MELEIPEKTQKFSSFVNSAGSTMSSFSWLFDPSHINAYLDYNDGSPDDPVLTVIVRDHNDIGTISFTTTRSEHKKLGNGNWHQLTITAIPNKKKGHYVYLDGYE